MFKQDVKAKTREILGLQYDPYSFSKVPRQTYRRSTSTSSSSSSDLSIASPSSSSSCSTVPSLPSSPRPCKNAVFEKVRQMTPIFMQSTNMVQSILDAVTDAMEEEEAANRASARSNSLLEELPTDLQTVDTTAFQRLIAIQPMLLDPRLFR